MSPIRTKKRMALLPVLLILAGALGLAPSPLQAAPKGKCLNLEALYANLRRPGVEAREATTDMKIDHPGVVPAALADLLSRAVKPSAPGQLDNGAKWTLTQQGCESIRMTLEELPMLGVLSTKLTIVSYSPTELVLKNSDGSLSVAKLVGKNRLVTTGTVREEVRDTRCPEQEAQTTQITASTTLVWGPEGKLGTLEASENLRNLLSAVLSDAAHSKCPAVSGNLSKKDESATPDRPLSLQNGADFVTFAGR